MQDKYPFDSITIIYNPNSTGSSGSDSKTLADELGNALDDVRITLQPTEYAGHAEELAHDIASSTKRALIVSASGDGGYNEVVNGVLSANDADTAVAVLPSGNANDHNRAVESEPLRDHILAAEVRAIDAIRVEGIVDSKEHKRYAHSYVGIGLTAYIGKKLTQATLNPINEKWLVLKYMVRFGGVRLRLPPQKKPHRYSSVVFSNISQMSKVIKLAPDADLADGELECYTMRTYSFWGMIFSLLFASTVGFRPTKRVTEQVVLSEDSIEVQLDGESMVYDAGHEVKVAVDQKRIRCL